MNGMGLDLASDLSFNSVNLAATDATSTLLLTASTDQGCSAAMAIEHTVHPQVTANFDLPASTCTPMVVAFNNTSIQATASTTWNFGDGTTSDALNPAHTFEALGTEDVQYNVKAVTPLTSRSKIPAPVTRLPIGLTATVNTVPLQIPCTRRHSSTPPMNLWFTQPRLPSAAHTVALQLMPLT